MLWPARWKSFCPKAAIEQEPQRSDLRLKLMQVYGEQGAREDFVAQERQLAPTALLRAPRCAGRGNTTGLESDRH